MPTVTTVTTASMPRIVVTVVRMMATVIFTDSVGSGPNHEGSDNGGPWVYSLYRAPVGVIACHAIRKKERRGYSCYGQFNP